MDYTLATYTIYLLLATAITLLSGHLLYKNGRPLLHDTFQGDTRIADSVNRLLLAGFFMLTGGYISLNLGSEIAVLNATHMVEKLSDKIGTLLLILAATHFANLLVLWRLRRRRRSRARA